MWRTRAPSWPTALAGCLAVAIAATAPARADEADEVPAPITVVVAAADAARRAELGALADEIARAQGIDRARQAHAWAARTRDGYQPADRDELIEAAATVERVCAPSPYAAARAYGDDVGEVRRAAATLARATGNEPDAPHLDYGELERFASAARQARWCLGEGDAATRTATVAAAAVTRAPRRGGALPRLYVDGEPAMVVARGDTLEFEVPAGRAALIHVRCAGATRCSPLVRVPEGTAVPAALPLVDLDLRARVDDALALTYAGAFERNERVGADASAVAAVLGARSPAGGASLVVMDEGAEVRLLVTDRTGAPARTTRAAWSEAAAAATALIAGASAPAIATPRDGLHTVTLHEVPGAPRLATGATRFDGRPTGLRQYCRGDVCHFAAPPGRLQLTLRRTGAVNDELVRAIAVDADLDITAVPGRRYAAKYVGEGLMLAGGGVAIGTALAMGLLNKAGQSACSAVTSGPDDCDQRSFTSDTAATVFFSAAGTAAVGAFLYFVVHKRPSLRIRKR